MNGSFLKAFCQVVAGLTTTTDVYLRLTYIYAALLVAGVASFAPSLTPSHLPNPSQTPLTASGP